MYKAKAYSATSAASRLASTTIVRRDPTETDVQIEILFCGVCHSDLHQARNEWSGFMPTVYPCVPGHESLAASPRSAPQSLNSNSATFAAVGLHGRLRRHLPPRARLDSNSSARMEPLPYNLPDKHLGGVTYAATPTALSSTRDLSFMCPRISTLPGLPPCFAPAPITTYSPMRHWGVTKGKKVGVVGSWRTGPHGREVCSCVRRAHSCFHTSPSKKDDALRLGADEVVLSRDANEMQKHAGSFDFILDAVAARSRHQRLHQHAAHRRQHHAGWRARKPSARRGPST